MQKVLLITGASRGIGAATARLAAARGWAVAVNYHRQRDAAQAVVDAIRADGGRAVALAGDVASEADVLRLFADTEAALGPLSALVNNAGVLAPQMPLADMDVARWQRMLATNVLGPLLCCREAVRRLSTRLGGQGGVIVNVSSAAARLGSPGEYVDYAASKGALDTLTLGLAKEVAAEGIRVNGVRPGFIYTDMHADGGEPGRVDRVKAGIPMQRGGQPEEVAAAILWLLSDEASFTTGHLLDVAGGR
ncbi:NAD(P)-dependent dehydrogenase (short-subunit alcohol dehydrogenase family) [Vogesella perlucida]|jgi:NAD(P)-dependent dehydrogenase (short-subunit alcohol dehydrogenase family)|nr:NAD(P)-dependent dehydrogenase (short-subunit alcohol dehydrogenase family) [Vogesella perlucida]